MAMPVQSLTTGSIDGQPRPYFLFERAMDEPTFRRILGDPGDPARPALLRELLREARPEDVWKFVTPELLAAEWAVIAPGLGRSRVFWEWLLNQWRARGFFSA